MSRTDKLLDLRKLKTRRKRETNSKAIESASLEGGVCCGDRTEGRGRRTGLGLWMWRSGSPPHTHTHQKAPCERRASGSRSADPTVGKRAIQAEGRQAHRPEAYAAERRAGAAEKGQAGGDRWGPGGRCAGQKGAGPGEGQGALAFTLRDTGNRLGGRRAVSKE